MEHARPRRDSLKCGTAVFSLQGLFAEYSLLPEVLLFLKHISSNIFTCPNLIAFNYAEM